MKHSIILTIAGLSLIHASANFTQAQDAALRLVFRDLPAPVQKAVREDKDQIKRIERFTHTGQTVFEVRFDREGAPDKLIYLAENGVRITDRALIQQRQADRRQLHLKNLPKPVQTTFRKESGNGKMDDINVENADGTLVYEIDFTKDGKVRNVRIRQDGTMLAGGQINPTKRSAFERHLSGAQKINLDKAPEAVRSGVRAAVRENRVEDIERGTLDGKTVYEVAFKEKGVHNEIRVTEDGKVIDRVGIRAAQEPTLSNVRTDQLPQKVRRTIRTHIGAGEISDIHRREVHGKSIYDIQFKRENGGVQQRIQVAEDGAIINEGAGSQRQ